jgi:uncharacterized pyridoxamine 5'-phosphate oxidase family protein
MSQIEVSLDESRERIAQELRKYRCLYLATCEGGFVTVRYMGFLSEGLTIWFRTDKETRKYEQIAANANVAIAGPELQIEGVASLKGHPLNEENSDYIRLLRELRPEQFERASRPGRGLTREDTRLIEVNPRRILLNVYSPNFDLEPDVEPHVLVLNVPQEKAHKMFGPNIMDFYRNPAYWDGFPRGRH